MKKLLFIAVIIFGVSAIASAQDKSFGLKLGYNSSSIVNEGGGFSKTSSASGFLIGGFMTIELSDKIALQPELVFATASDDGTINYLNIPVLAKYSFSDAFSAHAGLQLGFLMTAEDEDGEDTKDSFTSTNFSIPLGVDYELDMGLIFGVRYNIGLSDISDNDVLTTLSLIHI